MTYDEIAHDIKTGVYDSVLPVLLGVCQDRKAEIDKWEPINELVEMLRTIEHLATSQMETKAAKAAEMNTTLKAMEQQGPPLITEWAKAVRRHVYVELLGMHPGAIPTL